MKRQWTNEELVEHLTHSSKELDLIGDSMIDLNLLGTAFIFLCEWNHWRQEAAHIK